MSHHMQMEFQIIVILFLLFIYHTFIAISKHSPFTYFSLISITISIADMFLRRLYIERLEGRHYVGGGT